MLEIHNVFESFYQYPGKFENHVTYWKNYVTHSYSKGDIFGFYDAFIETENWFPPHYLAIDQGPIVVMIKNYRSGLLWNLFMKDPNVQSRLKKLGFNF
jgi:hypothetical protein